MIVKFDEYNFVAVLTEDSYDFGQTQDENIEISFSEDSFVCNFISDEFVCDFGAGVASDYDGPYTVTPSQQTQTLYTTEKTLTQNVVVNPIPSNYGKITWDGRTLTVS